MRGYLLIIILLFGSYGLFAQTASNYTFFTFTGGSIDITPTGWVDITPADRNNGVTAVQTLPFPFVYEGITYNQLSVSVDGWVKLGAVQGVPQSVNDITSATNIPKLFPWWDDLALNTFGHIWAKITGTAPNRIYIVEWRIADPLFINNATWQCSFYEGGAIDFRYAGSLTTFTSASVGINGVNAANFISVSTDTHTSSNTVPNNSVATWPNGRIYNFNPPPQCSGTPATPAIPASAGFCQPSGTVVLTATNLPGGLGITYQWEESNDNGITDPWANAVGGSGATTHTYTSAVLTANIYYRLKTTCTNSGISSTSNVCAVSSAFCSFNVNRSVTTFNSISATGNSISGWRNGNNTNDNLSTAQPIGFNFKYRGTLYSQFAASTNGYLTFNTGTSALGDGSGAYGYDNAQFSSTTGTLNAIAPFYEDQVTPGNPGTAAGLAAAIKYQVSGSAPNRVLTVEWIGMETFNNTGPNLNYQVKLYETSNVVELVYGTMAFFDGSVNFGYSYTVGVNAQTLSATPTIEQLQSQQADNLQNFAPIAKNDLDQFIDCNIKYTFTPGNYGGAGSAPALINDEPAGAITLATNSLPCAQFCGTYYTGNGATTSAGINSCGTGSSDIPDDDVWFKFTVTTAQQNVTVRGGGGYDAVVELFAGAGITPIACVNATGAGLTETLNVAGLIPGNVYYIRVYHAGTGSNNTGTTTGNTATGGVPDFSICINEVAPPSCTTNITPVNGAAGQNVPLNLSWNTAARATSYTVFMGTGNPPTAADSLTTVNGTSVTLLNLAGNTTYYWYVVPKNGSGPATGCSSNTTSFSTALIYCIPAYSNNLCSSRGDSISYFSLKGEGNSRIINVSGGSCGATFNNYSNYTGIGSVNLAPAKSYSGKLKVNPGFSEGVSMWIDFNDNGLFEGTEKVLNHITVAPADGQLLYSIYIPIGSPSGLHRLRMRAVADNTGINIDPCTSYGFGETEDYLVNILAATPTYVVSAPPAPGTCITAGITTIDSLSNNRNVVVPLVDSLNNIVASVNALNQNLGRVTTQYYLHNSNNGANTRQDAISGAPPVPAYYLDRNLRISVATQPATPVNVRMYVSAADLANYNVAVPSTAIGNLNVHKTNQNFCATQAAGDSAYIAATGSGTLGTDYFVDFSSPSFSNFYLFRGAAVLPVSITGLSAKATGSTNTVYWTTQQEQNNQKFIVERSANGRNFTAIGEVNSLASNGNSSSPLNYQFVDAQPLEGKSYYRLQQVDRGGEKRQTPVVTVLRGKGQLEIVDVRPNPTNGKLYFNVIGGGNSALTVVVRSLNGSEVLRRSLVQGGNFSIDLNGVANGMYMLEAMNRNGEKAVFKIVKQ